MARKFPSVRKLAVGLTAAAFITALPVMLIGAFVDPVMIPIGFLIAAAHAVVLGLPAYLLFRRWFHINYGNAAAAGLLIGATPMFVYVMVTLSRMNAALPGFNQSGFQQVQQAAEIAGIGGVLGAIGGLAFRGVLGPDEEVFEVDPAIFE